MHDLPGFSQPAETAAALLALSFFIAGPLIGWLAQRLVIGWLRRRPGVTARSSYKILVKSIRHISIWWLTLLGGFVAMSALPLDARLRDGLGKLILGLFLASATLTAGRIAAAAVRIFSARTDQPTRSSSIFVKLSWIIVAVLGLLVVMQTFGISITPLLTALGVGGLAVALALQDTLSNFFSGLQIIATKKVKPGDYVRLENGEEGHVTDIDWRHTSIRQLPSNMVLVPNSKLVNSILTNYHYPDPEMSVLVDVGVSYESDLQEVERVTIEVARETLGAVPGGVPDFEPFIRFHTFNDSSIDFTTILRVREFTDQYILKHEFIKRLRRRYDAEGIVIPFPIRTLDWPEGRRLPGDGDGSAARQSEASQPR